MKHILIVEDEKNIVELLKYNLESRGYKVSYSYDGCNGLKLFNENKYDLILLDLMLPYIDGIELCKRIRQVDLEIPIIILTAKSSETDKILGLNKGADDYITKPFSIKELIARIEAILRRTGSKSSKLKIADLYIDFDKHLVCKNEKELDLTLKEFNLLKLLISREGNPLTREEILEEVWGYEFIGETRTVDVHIRNLRAKIETDDKKPAYIITVRGIGYKFGAF